MIKSARSLGIIAIVAATVWFSLGAAVQLGARPLGEGFIGFSLVFYGFIGGPVLAFAILFAISGRRKTVGEWVGWAFIVSGLGWGFYAIGVLTWVANPNPAVTNTGLISSFVLFAGGVGLLALERRALGTVAIVAGSLGLAFSLVFAIEFIAVGGYLFFFTPFPLDVVLLGGVLWGLPLLLYGRELQKKEKTSIPS